VRVAAATLKGCVTSRHWLAAAGLLLLLLLCLHQVFGPNGYLALRARQAEVRQLQAEVRRLAENNQRLERELERLRNDPAAIERLAREEMKLARPGEVIFTLPAPPPSPPAPLQARNK
jgi:cell division protein FtsB